jgi:hypothetical protein
VGLITSVVEPFAGSAHICPFAPAGDHRVAVKSRNTTLPYKYFFIPSARKKYW